MRTAASGSNPTARECTKPVCGSPHRRWRASSEPLRVAWSGGPEHPIVEGELLIEGIRFEGLLPPVARKPCCVMRKSAQVLYTLDDYIRDRILDKTHAQVLREAIDRRLNIVVAGGTGSGKTTLAGAMINEMVERSDPNERYVIIEDTLEIQCRAHNLVQLHTAESADMTRLVRPR